MTDIVTGIKLKGDASGLVGETRRAREELGKLSPSLDKAGNSARHSSTQFTAMRAATGTLTTTIKSMFSPVNLLTGGISALIGAMGVSKVIQFSDEMKRLDNQLKLVTKTEKERIAIQKQLLGLSNQTYSDVGATTELYTKMQRATKELNVSQQQLLAVTRAINQSFVISGASTAEAEGSTRQLAQALASGAFRGDEFNSVAEQAPRLMEALSTQLGVTIGDLRDMAAEGKLTSEILVGALINQSGAINREFAKMAPTAGQAMTVVDNNFKVLVKTVNDATKDFGGLTNGILGFADVLDGITQRIASGEVVAYIEAYAGAWSGWAASVSNSIDIASDAIGQFPLQVLAAKAITEESLNLLGKSFTYWPQNVKAMVQAVVVELANLQRKAKTYGFLIAEVILNELKRLVAKAKAYAMELADIMNPFDGDTFNLDAELAQIENYYNDQAAAYKKSAEDRINASNQARDAVVDDILAERQAAIDSTNAQIAAAKALASAKSTGTAANDNTFNGDNVVPFKPAGSGEDANPNDEYEKLKLRFATREEALRINAQNEMKIIADAMAQKKITEEQGLELIYAAREKHLAEIRALENAKANMLLSSGQQIFGGLASLTKTFMGEQSGAYKVMFAAAKGFAIAQGTLNFTTALMDAFSKPWPLNIPLMAQAAATGGQLLANIKGVQLQGQAHGGLDKNVREGTWWLRNDEMVMNPQQRRSFENLVAANDSGQLGGRGASQFTYSPNIVIDARNAVPGMEAQIAAAVEQGQRETYAKFQEDFASGGPLAQSLRGTAAA